MAQANPNAGAQQPATYQELYNAMPDVFNGQYMTYLAPFGPQLGEQSATLRDCVIMAANNVPKVFAMLQREPTPLVMFVHRPTRYASSLLGAQPWDDCVFGFEGDIRQGNQVNLMEWPADPFWRSIMITVPTLNRTDDAWREHSWGGCGVTVRHKQPQYGTATCTFPLPGASALCGSVKTK
jgi:hypothetical protein